MKTYHVIITTHQAIEVQAESEEQAIEFVRSRMTPRDAQAAEFQIAQEVNLEEN
jgi:hypothetical protein